MNKFLLVFISWEICAIIHPTVGQPPRRTSTTTSGTIATTTQALNEQSTTTQNAAPPPQIVQMIQKKKCHVNIGDSAQRSQTGGIISLFMRSVIQLNTQNGGDVMCDIDIPKANTLGNYYYVINMGRKILDLQSTSNIKVLLDIQETDSSSRLKNFRYQDIRFNNQPMSYISSTSNVNLFLTLRGPDLTKMPDFTLDISWHAIPYQKDKLNRTLSDKFCPKGMDYYRGRCYLFIETPSLNKGRTWGQAGRRCERLASSIVQINDENEMNFVWNQYIVPAAQRYGAKQTISMFVDVKNLNKAKYSEWYVPDDFLQETPENIYIHQPNNTGKYKQINDYNNFHANGLNPSLVSTAPLPIMQPYPSLHQTCVVVFTQGLNYKRKWARAYCEIPIPVIGIICETKSTEEVSVSMTTVTHTCPKLWTMFHGKCIHMKSEVNEHTPLQYNNSQTVHLLPLTMIFMEARELCSSAKASILQMNATERVHLQHYITSVWRHRPMDMGVIVKDEAGHCVNMQLKYTDNPVYLDEMEWNEVRKACDDAEFEWATNVICYTPTVPYVIPQCGRNQFTCPSDKSCIPQPYVCDGKPHCADEEDEQDCNRDSTFEWHCDNKTISMAQYCDFYTDCLDGTDEKYCSFTPCLNTSEFQCHSGQCIQSYRRCDFIKDCWGKNTDELRCSAGDLEEDDSILYCANGTRCYTGKCIPESSQYDSFPDCTGFVQEDEKGPEIPRVTKQAVTCYEEDSVRCRYDHPHCFPRNMACIDENNHKGLPYCRSQEHLRDCKDFECPDMFKCPNSYCIPLRKVNDEVADCPYGEDENVGNHDCSGLFRCFKGDTVTRCISQREVCDGINHCPESNDDEKFCDTHICPAGCNCHYRILTCGAFANANTTFSAISTYSKWRSIAIHNSEVTLSNDSFSQLHLLGTLNLTNSKIKSLPLIVFYDLKSLYHLDLTSNLLTYLPERIFSQLQVLKHLFLEGNPLHSFESRAFYGLTLQYLSLQNLQLKSIPSEAFVGMSNVKEIDLRNNQIKTIEKNAFKNPGSLSILRLENNSIQFYPYSSFQEMQIKQLSTDSFGFCCLATNVENCSPSPDEFSSCTDLLSNSVLKVAMWVMGFLALIGNIAVMIIHGRSKKKTKHIILIINLAVSDLLMGIYLLMISSANQYYHGDYFIHETAWRSGPVCSIAGFISIVSSEMSVYTLVLISLDRMVAILFPMRANSWSKKPWYAALVIGWIICILIAVLPLVVTQYFSSTFYGHNAVCLPLVITSGKTGAWEYNVGIVIVVNLLCFIFITVAYMLIWKAVRRSRQKMKSVSTSKSNVEVTLAIKAAFVVFTDFCCWAPVIILSLLALGGWSVPADVTAWMAVFVIPINSSINPFLYTISTLRNTKQKPSSATPKTTSTVTYDSPQVLHKFDNRK